MAVVSDAAVRLGFLHSPSGCCVDSRRGGQGQSREVRPSAAWTRACGEAGGGERRRSRLDHRLPSGTWEGCGPCVRNGPAVEGQGEGGDPSPAGTWRIREPLRRPGRTVTSICGDRRGGLSAARGAGSQDWLAAPPATTVSSGSGGAGEVKGGSTESGGQTVDDSGES